MDDEYNSKECIECGVNKSLGEFYKHLKTRDGHINTCKECKREYMKNRPKERLREIDKKRNQKPKRKADRRKRWEEFKETEEYAIKRAEYNKRYIEKYPEKYKAHYILSNAIRDGKIKRKDCCEVCQSSKQVEGHHDDYSKPLDVKWLCNDCHVKAHVGLDIPF